MPQLEGRTGPRYLAIADSLAADIAAGRLRDGDRLPTHRSLAQRLGVTVGTVTRAYAEIERRGLIKGEFRRGTQVVSPEPLAPPPPGRSDSVIDLTRNFPPEGPVHGAIGEALAEVGRGLLGSGLLGYEAAAGHLDHRAAGAAWLRRSGVDARTEEIVVTSGAQHGMIVAMAACARPGDAILTEPLTFNGMKSIAALMGYKLHAVAADEHGLQPEAVEAACRQLTPRALYLVPTLQNPTNAIMPRDRRVAIADICRRHSVTIVEDDIYGFLVEDAPPPIAQIAPDVCLYVTSLSKALAPGLRVGFVRAPADRVDRLIGAIRTTVWMASPILGAVATRLIRSGAAGEIAHWQREEAQARQAIATKILAGADFVSHPSSFHIWLRLPEPWRRESFANALRQDGVGVTPADSFAIGRYSVPHAVRVSLCGACDRAELATALNRVAGMLSAEAGMLNPML